MLGRELIRARCAGKYIHPLFADTCDAGLLAFARDLVTTAEQSIGSRVCDLDSALEGICEGYRDAKLASGLVKTLLSRAVFSSASGEVDLKAERKTLFAVSAGMLRGNLLPADPSLVRDSVLLNAGCGVFAERAIYSDLPENDILLRLKKTFPRELLERYNISLVQSILLFARSIKCVIPPDAAEPQELRRLFKYLRFFRLLASAEKKEKNIELVIDGPASILENSLKYALQLASFFPALCKLKRWKISAEIRWRNRTLQLALDEKSALVSHYMNFSAYKPEELLMFADYFKKHVGSWLIDDCPDFLLLDGRRIIFPDYVFTNAASGEIRLLELFHRWHSSELSARLDYIEKHPDLGLFIGADSSIVKNSPELKARLTASGGFTFSSYPGAEKVASLLG